MDASVEERAAQGDGEGSGLMDVGMTAAMEAVQSGATCSEAAALAAAAVGAAGGSEGDAIAASGTAAAFTAATKGLTAQEAATVAAAAATAAGGSHLDAASAAGAAASSVVTARGGAAADASQAAADAQARLGLCEGGGARKRQRVEPAVRQRRCFSEEELRDPGRLPFETADEDAWLRGEALPRLSWLCARYFTTKKRRHAWGMGASLRWAYKPDPYERRCAGCRDCDRWRSVVSGDATGMPQYEVFNADHIEALAAYFIVRMAELGLPALSVVEVGAGDGRLSHFLRVALAKSDAQGADRVTITATDDNSRQLEQFYAVETCDAAEVMNRFQPDVVLVSWMELGQDWTSSFRACESVREYVLVGEVDAGACGHPWNTWGHTFRDCAAKPGDVAPFAAGGFERVELDELSALQLSQFDEPWQKHVPRMGDDGQLQPWCSWSHTVSFRRAKAE